MPPNPTAIIASLCPTLRISPLRTITNHLSPITFPTTPILLPFPRMQWSSLEPTNPIGSTSIIPRLTLRYTAHTNLFNITSENLLTTHSSLFIEMPRLRMPSRSASIIIPKRTSTECSSTSKETQRLRVSILLPTLRIISSGRQFIVTARRMQTLLRRFITTSARTSSKW